MISDLMNSFAGALGNSFAGNALLAILNVSWRASMIAAIVLALQALCGRHLPARWRFVLWFIVLLRFSAVPLPESRLSIFNWSPLPAASAAHAPASMDSPLHGPDTTDVAVKYGHSIPAVHTPSSEPHVFPWSTLLMAIYGAGVFFILMRAFLSSRSLRQLLRAAEPVTDPAILRALNDALRSLAIRRRVPLLVMDGFSSPALVGLFRPRIVIPRAVLDTFTPHELHLVFLHECAHLRRCDVLINYWCVLLGALHWFNPLYWLMLPRLRADRELAADELVLHRTADAAALGRMLLKLLDTDRSMACLGPSGVGIFETRSYFKRRITMIATFRPARAWAAVFALGLLLTVAACSLTSAPSDVAPQSASTNGTASRPTDHVMTRAAAIDAVEKSIKQAIPADWTLARKDGNIHPWYWDDGGEGTEFIIKAIVPRDKTQMATHLWLMAPGYKGKPHDYKFTDPQPQTTPPRLLGDWRGGTAIEWGSYSVREIIIAALGPDLIASSPASTATAPATRAKITNTTGFQKVNIVWYADKTGRFDHTARRFATVQDPAVIARLLACFPGAGKGKESPRAGAWLTCAEFKFIRPDGTALRITVDPELTVWSEGNGDWPIKTKFLEEFLRTLP